LADFSSCDDVGAVIFFSDAVVERCPPDGSVTHNQEKDLNVTVFQQGRVTAYALWPYRWHNGKVEWEELEWKEGENPFPPSLEDADS
jgi:hypothetical protein